MYLHNRVQTTLRNRLGRCKSYLNMAVCRWIPRLPLSTSKSKTCAPNSLPKYSGPPNPLTTRFDTVGFQGPCFVQEGSSRVDSMPTMNAPDSGAGIPSNSGPETQGDVSTKAWLPIRIRRIAQHPRLAFVLPLLIGLATLAWTRGSNLVIYSEDGTSFVNPFGFSANPFSNYGYLSSSSLPIPDHQTYFYFDTLSAVFTSLGLSASNISVILLAILVGLGSLGVVILLRTLNRTLNRPAHENFLGFVLATLLYAINPFTLSVVWWHFSGWTFFYAALPWILAATLALVYLEKSEWIVVLVAIPTCMVLAPGLTGGFAPTILLILLTALMFLVVRYLRRELGIQNLLLRLACLTGFVVCVVGWSFLPFLLAANQNGLATAAPSGTAGSFVNASLYTSLWNVSRLVAFSWIYSAPNTYPWIGLLPWISIVGAGIPLLYGISLLRTGRKSPLILVAVLGLLGLSASLQGNPPTGNLNQALFGLGGPFLPLVAGYYFVGELWVLAVCVGVHAATRDAAELRVAPSQSGLAESQDSSLSRARFRTNQRGFLTSRVTGGRWLRGVSIVLTVAVLAVTSFPFVDGQVYQSSGPNVTEITIPSSFEQLQTFFHANYSGPNYDVLVLPFSSTGGMYLNLGSGGLADDGIILSRYIPYPLLWGTTEPSTVSFDDFLANGTWVSLTPCARIHARPVCCGQPLRKYVEFFHDSCAFGTLH